MLSYSFSSENLLKKRSSRALTSLKQRSKVATWALWTNFNGDFSPLCANCNKYLVTSLKLLSLVFDNVFVLQNFARNWVWSVFNINFGAWICYIFLLLTPKCHRLIVSFLRNPLENILIFVINLITWLKVKCEVIYIFMSMSMGWGNFSCRHVYGCRGHVYGCRWHDYSCHWHVHDCRWHDCNCRRPFTVAVDNEMLVSLKSFTRVEKNLGLLHYWLSISPPRFLLEPAHAV